MAQDQKSGKGKRLGTQLRGRLAEAYASRGRLKAKLTYAYSPRMRRDIILPSELEYWNFILLESDPSVLSVDYSPPKKIALVGDDVHGTVLDAVVAFRDGTIEWREVKYSDDDQTRTVHQQQAQEEAAYQEGAIYRRFTEREIFSCGSTKLLNWMEIVAWLSAVRDRPTLEFDLAVTRLLKENGSATISEIQALADSRSSSACYVAAAFKKLQDGYCFSDLDMRPLTENTVLRVGQ